MSKTKKMLVLGGVAAAAIGMAATAATALADPPAGTTPAHTDIVGTGSDTIQLVEDKLTADYDATHTTGRQWYSWDAFPGSATITEKVGCPDRTRPNGSGAGIAELEANIRPSGDTADYCVDYARSSSGRQPTDPSSIIYIPFAIDGVTWSADLSTGHSNATQSLTTTQLQAIYSCDASILGNGDTGPVKWNEVGGTSSAAVVPVIPQSSSGTRKFFLKSIGVTTLGGCVQGQDNSVEENEGTNAIFSSSSAPNIVFPYSIAVYLAQTQYGHGAGDQGSQVLRKVNGKAATTGTAPNKKINTQFPYLREVYNVTRNADKTGATQKVPGYVQPIFGSGTKNTGWLCTNATAKADIQNFGFALDPNCGAKQ